MSIRRISLARIPGPQQSAEGTRFAEIVTEMDQRIRQLVPSPLRPDPAALEKDVQKITLEAQAAIAGDTQ